MGKIVARNASIYLDDSSSACQAFSGLTNSVAFSQTAEAPDVTSFGSDLAAILGGSTFVRFGPSGSTATCVMYSASAVLTEYSMDFGVADAATVTYTLVQRSGSMTRGVWA